MNLFRENELKYWSRPGNSDFTLGDFHEMLFNTVAGVENHLEIKENGTECKVIVDLPGIDPKTIEITEVNGYLVFKDKENRVLKTISPRKGIINFSKANVDYEFGRFTITAVKEKTNLKINIK